MPKTLILCLFGHMLFGVNVSLFFKKQALDCTIIGKNLKRLHIDNITEKMRVSSDGLFFLLIA
jgi:hypothetical protein